MFDDGDFWFDMWLIESVTNDQSAPRQIPSPPYFFAADEKQAGQQQLIDKEYKQFFKELKSKAKSDFANDNVKKSKFNKICKYIESNKLSPLVDAARYRFNDQMMTFLLRKQRCS